MKKILVIGAGRSATSLIKYLLEHSIDENWKITVADVSLELAQQKINNHPNATAIVLDINNEEQRQTEIKKADLIISMLPAHLHLNVAVDCIKYKKHLATASYVSKEMGALHDEAKNAGVILLNEMGLDPGIDHASAMQIIDKIHEQGGEILSFKSYCGGLVAPESNDNPWGYKFSWNPRNVVLAGQGTAKYIENGKYKYIPYNRLFKQIEQIQVDGIGYDGYANRDSLSYRKIYNLENIPTMLRGTLRQQGYCNSWNVFVKLGLTDDSYAIESSEKMTYSQLLDSLLPEGKGGIKQRLIDFMGEEMSPNDLNKIEWLGIFENQVINLPNATPAQALQKLLESKWVLKPEDKDMIVMQHLFSYALNNKTHHLSSSLIVKGDDNLNTAMSKTVGLPLAIASKLILQNKIDSKGIVLPVIKELYEPVLKELKLFGINFTEKEKN